jgi:hypothetical protein
VPGVARDRMRQAIRHLGCRNPGQRGPGIGGTRDGRMRTLERAISRRPLP